MMDAQLPSSGCLRLVFSSRGKLPGSLDELGATFTQEFEEFTGLEALRLFPDELL